MGVVLVWWVSSSLLGWITFPLTWKVFSRLADRGFGLTKALGLLAGGYIFWVGVSFNFLENTPAGALGAFLILAIVSLALFTRQREEMVQWIKENSRLLLTIEGIFLISFILWAFVRANNPQIQHTEKPMELAFLNSIIHSEGFPPKDPWLSGYAISYYYYGYILLGFLAQLTSTISSEVFNLGNALWFALTALGAYSILFNLLAAGGKRQRLYAPIIAPIMILILGNYEAILEILYHQHIFWDQSPDGQFSSGFWSWLNLDDLSRPPTGEASWIPNRFLWWWQASRVVQDVNLAGQPIEVIDEFPFFSFLLADNHPHLLSLPFALLAVSGSLNMFLREARSVGLRVLTFSLVLDLKEFLALSWLFGALAFLNTWDLPIYFSLLFVVLIWQLRFNKVVDLLKKLMPTVLILLIGAFFFYLPWYPGFSSQAGGILPNVLFPTRFSYFFIMFGPLILFIAIWLWRDLREYLRTGGFRSILLIALGTPVVLLAISTLLALIIYLAIADQGSFLATILSGLGVQGLDGNDAITAVITSAIDRRLSNSWTALFLGLVFASSIGPLHASRSDREEELAPNPKVFVLLMTAIGTLLVIGPEFLYVRDTFGTRMNTVFKFYFAAWVLWGIVAGYAFLDLMPNTRSLRQPKRALLLIPLVCGLIYPVLALRTKTEEFNPSAGRTIDGTAYLATNSPEDYQAIEWLVEHAQGGVIAEAVGGSYTEYARISTHTGLTTVLGWPGHELQWRGGYEIQGTREQDIANLYTTTSSQEAQEIVRRYAIDYVYVGPLEHQKYQPPSYPPLSDRKFNGFMDLIYESGEVMIFKTRNSPGQ